MADTPFIQCHEQLVPEKEAHDLQLWLSKSECKTLIRIVESRAKQHTSKVANAALQAIGGSPLKMNLADEHLRQARQCLDFLEMLDQIKNQTEPFIVTKWK